MSALADKLKSTRAALALSQPQAAEAWGIPLPSLRKWEQNARLPRGVALTLLMEKLDQLTTEATPAPAAKPATPSAKRPVPPPDSRAGEIAARLKDGLPKPKAPAKKAAKKKRQG